MTDTLPSSDAARAAMRSRRRRLLLLATMFLLVGTLVYGAWWSVLASRIGSEVDAWFAGIRADGCEARFRNLSVGGFPFRIFILLDDIVFADPTAGWRIDIQSARANTVPWNPTEVTGRFDGEPNLVLDSGRYAGEYRLAVQRNRFVGAAGRMEAQMDGVELRRVADNEALQIGKFRLAGARGTASKPPLHVVFEAHKSMLPKSAPSPFGRDIERVRINAHVTGELAGSGSRAERLDLWRRGGGTLEIRRLDVAHGDLGLAGEGTLALDRGMQPEGAFTARITGFAAAVDRLIEAGLVARRDGAIAKLALGIMAKAPAGGGPPQLEVPLTLQDRWLSAGPFQLMRLPEARW